MAVGVSLGCIVLLGVIAVPVVYMRRQWARAEENKLRLTARMSGLDESEVRSEVWYPRHSRCPTHVLLLQMVAGWWRVSFCWHLTTRCSVSVYM